MGRIVAIDYGQKRVGIAVTDELQMIATALTTISANDVMAFLLDYTSREKIDAFVVGLPITLQNNLSESGKYTEPFVKQLKKKFPDIPVERLDERFTSKMASAAILLSGAPKHKRQDKSIIDKVSAVILLQDYLAMKSIK